MHHVPKLAGNGQLMSIVFGLAIFFVVWWITLFAVLPFGVHTQAESGQTVPGTPPGAPAQFRWGRVMLINTIVAVLVFGIIWMLIEYDAFNISELANKVTN
jgi:predicted secreted protein